ncbi:hypothetical protein F5J12DRAFT_781793 [Pisolithus orientalis]|uniref:uncharacterized protein n=1 Tax=Pisolithus orientalis TaxID=936130 RepID=UPI002224C293|nr:uncharacterized protein F5J12DRAFT_781793 [Pisolithus orientalis]KAI6010810.1 hypothetical protein F5J12DRAFT_781793 [Pisolithus orientalis]
MIGYKALPLGKSLNRKVKLTVTQHFKHLAFSTIAFTLWTRNYELLKLKCRDVKLDMTELSLTINEHNTYFKIHLKNHKGWQRKLDKGMREADLQSNHYKIYPCPDMGKPMTEEDFLFHTIGTNDMLQPGSGGVQNSQNVHNALLPLWWSAVPLHVHTSGAAMDPCTGLVVRQVVRSNTLQPVPHEGDHSLAGKAVLIQPASTKVLSMAHASITADVASLHMTVREVKEASCSLSTDFRMPQAVQPSDVLFLMSLPSCIRPQRIKTHMSTSLLGVVILDMPVLHPNGTQTPKSDSRRDIVHHWTEEFLNEFHGDDETSLKIYGSAVSQGHMKLLKVILAACKWYCGAGDRCHRLTSEEVCNDSSSVLQGISKQQ